MSSLASLLARQFRALVRAALDEEPGPDPPVLVVTQGPAGQVLSLALPGITIIHRVRGQWPPARFFLPLAALEDSRPILGPAVESCMVAPAASTPISAAAPTAPGAAAPPENEPLPSPEVPSRRWLIQPHALLHYLGQVADLAPAHPGPFDPGRVLLRGGSGEMLVSDGEQAVCQSGFSFPWTGDLLAPARGLRAVRLLPGDQGVALAHSGSTLCFRTGAWEVTLTARLGKFPLPDLLVRPQGKPSCLCLSLEDAALLRQVLRCGSAAGPTAGAARLELTRPATILLPGSAVSASSERLVLQRSRTEGPVRHLLTRTGPLRQALELGFRNFAFWPPGFPARAEEPGRTFAWRP